MIILHILILSAIPICLSQFSIQGPSDGNRAAQSLRYSEEKGIEYSDQGDSQGTGDFSIQGATDGNANFNIQGASDGNADFQIQGASDGNSNFQIQGATDGNSDFKIQGATDGNVNYQTQGATDGNYQSSIQGAYDANQGGQGGQRSLQYNDPNGFKLNWRSYAHGHLSPQPQQQQQQQQHQQQHQPEPAYTPSQAEAQYAPEPAHRPAPRPAPQRAPPQPAPQHTDQSEQQVPAQQPISYRPFDNAPAQIKQLLQFQSQIPYLNAIPVHLRYDNLQPAAQPQVQPQHDQAPQDAPQRAAPPPQYRQRPRGHPRSKRQAHPHQGQQQQQQPQQPQQQYRRIPQPAPETLPQYSTNVPSNIKQLLQFQSQIPYLSVVPEKFRYNLETAPTPAQPYQSPGIQQNRPQGGHQRSKRQAHQQQRQNHQQQEPQPQQYRRIPQPAPEVLPQYSTNLPSQLKQLLQFQSQIPYVNAIPDQFRYNLENAPAPAQPHSSQHSPQNTAGGGHQRGKREAPQHRQPQQPQHQPQQQYRRIPQPAPEVQPQYSANVPQQIKQLLQFQSQIPYLNAIPEQFRYNLENVQHAPQSGGHPRSRRQAQGQHQQQLQQQYERIPQPAPEAQPQYSTNLPNGIQQILNFQAQTPYDIIANRIIYQLDKPYVPEPVASPVSNYPPASSYQGRGQGDIRPVKEYQ